MDLKKYEERGFTKWQIEEIRQAYGDGITEDLIDRYMSDPRFDHLQLEVIRKGLKAGIDVSIYAQVGIEHGEMEKILERKLEEKEDEVSDELYSKKLDNNNKRIKLIRSLIITLCILGVLFIIGALVFTYKDEINYRMQDLTITLKEKEITLDVFSDFNPQEYIESVPEEENVSITYPDFKADVIGDHEIEYKADNGHKIFTAELLVHVVDTTPPNIDLKSNEVDINYNVHTFNCEYYVDSVSDNYDTELEFTCSSDIDWDKSQNKVIYEAEDSSGNKTSETLVVNIVKPDPKPAQNESESTQSKPSQNSGGGGSESNASKPEVETPAETSKPFIKGVKNMSVTKGTRLEDLIYLLTANVSTSSNMTVDYTSVNLSVEGEYPVRYYNQEGVVVSCIVTVY